MKNYERVLHIIAVDVPQEMEKRFNNWYEKVHIPAILACPGWLSVKRYFVMEGGPKYMAVYEVAGLWAYETEEFRRSKGFDMFEPFVRNLMRIRGLEIYSWREDKEGNECDS